MPRVGFKPPSRPHAPGAARGLSAGTVFNDDAADVLTGAGGQDWFVFDSTRDFIDSPCPLPGSPLPRRAWGPSRRELGGAGWD